MLRVEDLEIVKKYNQMTIPALEKELGKLFRRRYDDYDLSVHEEHRIASVIFNRRTRSGTGMTFHMQKLVVK